MCAKESLLNVILAQHLQAVGADQRRGVTPQRATHHDQHHIGGIEHLLSDGQTVGYNSQMATIFQMHRNG